MLAEHGRRAGLLGRLEASEHLLEILLGCARRPAARLRSRILQPLAGDEHGELAHTLRALIACRLDRTATSAELHIHRNTLAYRLKRIEEVTGLDLGSPRDLACVYVALTSDAAAERPCPDSGNLRAGNRRLGEAVCAHAQARGSNFGRKSLFGQRPGRTVALVGTRARFALIRVKREMGMLKENRHLTRGWLRPLLVAMTVALASMAVVSAASAEGVKITKKWFPGFAAPETPARFDKVRVIRIAPASEKHTKNVLVLEPGTSAGAAYFVPFAKWLVENTKGWQVWSVERRENRFEKQTELTRAKKGEVTPEEFFDYYLGYLSNPAVKHHFNPVKEATAIADGARGWGMNVAVEDLHVVIENAKALGGKVVLGGHSLGGSVVTAYATWDFAGKPGPKACPGWSTTTAPAARRR